MSHKIVYAAKTPPDTGAGTLARLFRGLILIGVWILVALAAMAVWIRLAA